MLLEYLQERYKTNEPIFESDVDLPVTDVNLRQMFKVLCDSKKIERYDAGIYYFKDNTMLQNGFVLSAMDVIWKKYIHKNGEFIGYFSGYTFASQLGMTDHMPYKLEIVSNNASSKCREVSVGAQKIILRKSRTTVSNENCLILQFLDYLKDIDCYAGNEFENTAEQVRAYVKMAGMKREKIDQYIGLYPDKIYKYIYEMRLYDVFT